MNKTNANFFGNAKDTYTRTPYDIQFSGKPNGQRKNYSKFNAT